MDNEIAVQNLTKMAQQKGYASKAEKLAEREYRVLFTVGDAPAEAEGGPGLRTGRPHRYGGGHCLR